MHFSAFGSHLPKALTHFLYLPLASHSQCHRSELSACQAPVCGVSPAAPLWHFELALKEAN